MVRSATGKDGGDVIEIPTIEFIDDSEGKERFEPYVEWTGSVGHREITAEQWLAAGIEDQDTLVWTRESPRIAISRLTDDARQRLSEEPNFKFVTEPQKEKN